MTSPLRLSRARRVDATVGRGFQQYRCGGISFGASCSRLRQQTMAWHNYAKSGARVSRQVNVGLHAIWRGLTLDMAELDGAGKGDLLTT